MAVSGEYYLCTYDEMKFIKNVILLLVSVLLLGSAGIITYFWPVDSRLSGNFQSNAEDTIEYIKTKMPVDERVSNNLNRVLGSSTFTFDGHTITRTVKFPIIQNDTENSNPTMHEEKSTVFFLMVKSNKDTIELLCITSTFWELSNIEIAKLEFDHGGFWLIQDQYSALGREKYSKKES